MPIKGTITIAHLYSPAHDEEGDALPETMANEARTY